MRKRGMPVIAFLGLLALGGVAPVSATTTGSSSSGGSSGSGSGGSGDSGSSNKKIAPGMEKLLTEYCFDCAFPITIGGVATGSSRNVPSESYKPTLCWCKHVFGIPIPGVPYGAWIPERMIETVRLPYDSPIFGKNIGPKKKISATTLGALHGEPAHDTDSPNSNGFYNVHVVPYPVGKLYSSLLSMGCLSDTDGGNGDLYLSEIDPTWTADPLALFDTPEAALFASMPAQLACIADAVAADIKEPINVLFWCMGSWSSAYPQAGSVNASDAPRQSAIAAAHMIALMQRRALINETMGSGAICGAHPNPMLIKSMFKLEQLYPVPEVNGDHWIGEDPNLWGEYRYLQPPGDGENFVQLNWQWVDCCMY